MDSKITKMKKQFEAQLEGVNKQIDQANATIKNLSVVREQLVGAIFALGAVEAPEPKEAPSPMAPRPSNAPVPEASTPNQATPEVEAKPEVEVSEVETKEQHDTVVENPGQVK